MDRCANNCGGQHTYLMNGGVDNNGSPKSGTEGIGISGGGAGTLPSNELAFKPTICTPLAAKKNCKLPLGKGAGKQAGNATDAEIFDCMRNVPMSKPYFWAGYNCKSWAYEASSKCCVEESR